MRKAAFTRRHARPCSEIAAALGRVGDEGGLASGVAKLILEKRTEIEAAFSDLDTMEGSVK